MYDVRNDFNMEKSLLFAYLTLYGKILIKTKASEINMNFVAGKRNYGIFSNENTKGALHIICYHMKQ